MARKKATAEPEPQVDPETTPEASADPGGEAPAPTPEPAPPAVEPVDYEAAKEALADLKKIQARNARIARLRADWETKDASAKSAKKVFEAAQDELNEFIDRLTQSYPLFDKPTPAETEAEARPEAPASPLAAIPLRDVIPYGVGEAVVDRLAEHGIRTLAEFTERIATGQPLTKLKGIGEAKAKAITDAVANYLADHPHLDPAPAEPEAKPEAEVSAEAEAA